MSLFHLVLVVFLLYSSEAQVSSAVSPVFVQRGNDVRLDVHQIITLTETTDFYWKFNKTNNILKCNQKVVIFDTYKGRVEFYEQYSVLLKNLQHNDSGDYVALMTGNKDEQVAEYTVIVEDPVSPVKLTVISNSSDPCNITVTCSTVDSHITKTYRCDNKSCSYQGGEEATANYDSVNVTVQQGVIICNHSNHVSSKNAQMDIKTYCLSQKDTSSGAIAIGVVTSVLAAGLVCVFICFKCKRPIEQTNNENTIYAVPEDIIPAQTQIQTPTEDASTVSPTSTYALVQFHAGPEKSKNTINTCLPETVYAQVNRATNSNSRSLSSTNT